MVSKATLYYWINGCQDQVLYEISKQRLTPEKKKSIKSWVLDIQSWGFQPKITQLQENSNEVITS